MEIATRSRAPIPLLSGGTPGDLDHWPTFLAALRAGPRALDLGDAAGLELGEIVRRARAHLSTLRAAADELDAGRLPSLPSEPSILAVDLTDALGALEDLAFYDERLRAFVAGKVDRDPLPPPPPPVVTAPAVAAPLDPYARAVSTLVRSLARLSEARTIQLAADLERLSPEALDDVAAYAHRCAGVPS